ncbi:hypothetical protein MPTK1_5g00050 [Marchantia polymorpha subsp. ruderalis]|uniref:DNA-directed DNA polymerase n=2 Tax=Marchantia polymorpha TaxID=3197 RepID=A0AAF6BDA2_MARPO|nr:hypothetical protein MARPO_0078s0005 [Marchantia polymorpha]BBN09986.1 hypothetical protein Mp_5g00050 [Marchantia polymorpha subsp. ruderalis]|eukprot:PTQ34578.1 hypothetical protein MARPO_0078s0005 [Marchantia polymorpha]
MIPQGSKNSRRKPDSTDKLTDGLFSGVLAIFIETGVSRKRLQVWQRRFEDLGGTILTAAANLLGRVDQIIILAAHEAALSKGINFDRLGSCPNLNFVQFRWVEECLKDGTLLSYEPFLLSASQDEHILSTDDSRLDAQSGPQSDQLYVTPALAIVPDGDLRACSEVVNEKRYDEVSEECTIDTKFKAICEDDMPDYNKHISRPLLELSEIYSDVLADEWRSLTYRKVANKLDRLPYQILSADEVKNIQGIGKSMVDKIKEILCTGQLQKLFNLKASSQASIIVGGSYRRGNATCGDIDLLITHPDGHSHKGLLGRLVTKLEEAQFLITCPNPFTENITHKVNTYMGICKLPQYTHHRRIDIKIYPKQAYAFALVYFTGNDVLNRRIRYLAKKKGYKLSDQGLFLRVGDNKTGMASEVSIPCETEEEVFQKLGLPYPEPHERNW